MDNVEKLYCENKLLVRAMDWPSLSRNMNGLFYDCTTWANEFSFLMGGNLSSASSTLLVSGVGVSTYKNIGFLINSDLANCFHIAKTDSLSRGNIDDGDFLANDADFSTIFELAEYIKNNNVSDMNEVNIKTSIDSVVGLVINECVMQDRLLKMIYVIKRFLNSMVGIDYPIYSYDLKNGKLNKIELSLDDELQIIESLKTTEIFYWPDSYDDAIIDDIRNIKSRKR